jgi:hypothetical protein
VQRLSRNVPALALALALVCAGAAAVSAHHPFSSVYAMDRPRTIEGDVVTMVVRLPHSYIYLDVADARGAVHRWALEWESHDDGRGPGGPMETLHVGDRVSATGYPGRDPAAFRLLARIVTRGSDGWRWIGTNH